MLSRALCLLRRGFDGLGRAEQARCGVGVLCRGRVGRGRLLGWWWLGRGLGCDVSGRSLACGLLGVSSLVGLGYVRQTLGLEYHISDSLIVRGFG